MALRDFLLQCVRGTLIETKPHGKDVLIELKRIGNNINQIARRVNEGRTADYTDALNAIRDELRSIRTEWL